MNSKKIKQLAALGLILFLAIEVGGIFYALMASKTLQEEREQTTSLRNYLDILGTQKNDEITIIIITGIIFAIGVIFFYAFFNFLSPQIKNMAEARNFKCKKCGHLFKFSSIYNTDYSFSLFNRFVLFDIIYSAFNFNFFLKCPNCHKRSWCKLENMDKSKLNQTS